MNYLFTFLKLLFLREATKVDEQAIVQKVMKEELDRHEVKVDEEWGAYNSYKSLAKGLIKWTCNCGGVTKGSSYCKECFTRWPDDHDSFLYESALALAEEASDELAIAQGKEWIRQQNNWRIAMESLAAERPEGN